MTERDWGISAPPLSTQGTERRMQMRGELLKELSRARANRARLRRAAAGGAAGASLAVALVLALLRPAATQSIGGIPRVQLVESSAAAFSRWAVETDPDLLSRAALGAEVPEGTLIAVVDDEALVRALAAIGRPTGIVRSGDRVWTATSVTDPGGGG